MTEGFCHSAPWRHLASSLFHMMTCAYSRGGEEPARWRMAARCCPGSGSCHIRHLEGNRKPIQSVETGSQRWQAAWWPYRRITTLHQCKVAACMRTRAFKHTQLRSKDVSVQYISALWSDTLQIAKAQEHKYLNISAWSRLPAVHNHFHNIPSDSMCVIAGLRTGGLDEDKLQINYTGWPQQHNSEWKAAIIISLETINLFQLVTVLLSHLSSTIRH